jgi:hypothetical protein
VDVDHPVQDRAAALPLRVLDLAAPTVAAIPLAFVISVLLKGLADLVLPGAGSSELRGAGADVVGISKSGEWAFTFSFWPMVVGFAIFLFGRFQQRAPHPSTRQASLVLVVPAVASLLPIALGASPAPVYSLADNPILLAAWLQLPVIAFFGVQRWFSRRLGRPPATDVLPGLWLALAIALASVGAVVAMQRALAPGGLGTGGAVAVGGTLGAAMAGASGAWAARTTEPAGPAVSWCFAAAGIVALPLLLPPLLKGADGYVNPPGLDQRAWLGTIVVAALAIPLETWLRRRRGNREPRRWSGVSSVAIAVLLVAIRVAYRLPTVWSDDYHFGENFGPGSAWRAFGQVPYVNLDLPRGMLLNVVPDLANGFLNNGSAATFEYTAPIIALAVAAVAHLLLRQVVGTPAATAIVAMLAVSNGYIEGDLLVGSLAVWCIYLILAGRRSLLTGVVLAASIGFAVLAYPMMGLVTLGLTGGVLAAGIIGALLARDRAGLRRPLLLSAGAVAGAIILMVSPAGPLLRAATAYVASNAQANGHAFGIPLDLSWRGVPLGTGQLVHTAFSIGLLISAVLVWRRRGLLRLPSWSTYSLLAVAAVPGVVAVVLSSRFMGRIDVSEWPGRSTWGTLLVLGIIVPSVLLIWDTSRTRVAAWTVIGGATAITLVFLPVAQGGMLRNALGWIDRPETWPTEAVAAAVPTLGEGMDDEAHLARLAELAGIEAHLKRGERVLNVTDGGALSTYFEWRNPMSYLAPFNIESAGAEDRAVAALAADPPDYVLVGPGQWFDGMSLALRDPKLARWLMDHYSPFSCGTTTWATPRTGADWVGVGALRCPDGQDDASVRADAAGIWARAIGAGLDLDMLPATWGGGSPHMGAARPLEVSVQQAEKDQTVSSLTPAPRGSGGDELVGDLLVLDVTCPAGGASPPSHAADDFSTQTRASVSWPVGAGQEEAGQTAFRWGVGSFIVPLDAYPTWLLRADRSAPITLTVPTLGCTGSWAVDAQLADR